MNRNKERSKWDRGDSVINSETKAQTERKIRKEESRDRDNNRRIWEDGKMKRD